MVLADVTWSVERNVILAFLILISVYVSIYAFSLRETKKEKRIFIQRAPIDQNLSGGAPSLILHSGSVTWGSTDVTYIFPFHVDTKSWCPFWVDEDMPALMNAPILRSELYSLHLDIPHLESILLNWNDSSYSFSPFSLESRDVQVPAKECVGFPDEFAWKNNYLIASDRFRETVKQNATRRVRGQGYTRLVLLGTSETRTLFRQMCEMYEHPVLLNKTTVRVECGRITFFNMCSIGCSCDFKLAMETLQLDSGNAIISASCGLHEEYMSDIATWAQTFETMTEWASQYSTETGHLFQFRTANAINPMKTIPSHLTFARNNLRSKHWAQLALEVFFRKNIAILDVYRLTEPIFWKSSDHVHYHQDNEAVYQSLGELLHTIIEPFMTKSIKE